MSLLAKHSRIKEDRSNIVTLGSIAKKAKNEDINVINATIGMLYDENGKLFTYKSVNKVLEELTPEEKFSYPSTPGNPEYHEALKRWVFRQYYDEILSTMYCSVMATPGGSGAISNSFSNYLNPKDCVLLPEYMWPNYEQFAYENFATYETYSMFEQDHFNLKDIKRKIEAMKQRQKRVVLVINDPCHNPTGYNMKYEEWVELIRYINETTQDQTPFILIYDMAYIDYDQRGFDETRKNILLFKELNPSVLTILAFSGSKTMALYGLRVGAQIALGKDKQAVDEFFKANKFSSRAKWSMTTNLGMNLITKVILNQENRKEFEKELIASSQMLGKRAFVFLEECKKYTIGVLPFTCGFFVTIPCENPFELYERLVQKKIHIIPLEKAIRVTIAAISLEECKKIPKAIFECLKK